MSDPLASIGLQFKADEHHDQRAAAERVEDFTGATTPEPAAPALSPEQVAAVEEKAQMAALESLVKSQLPRVCAVLWGIVDRAAINFAGAAYAQTPEERAQLAEATAPVVLKYLPKDLSWLVNTPEGALLATAAVIYGAKYMADEGKKPEAPAELAPPSPPAQAPA